MDRRPSTTCLTLLALVVAIFLLSHDAMMAAGPHDAGAGAHAGAHGDHGDDPAGDTACGELVAARTNDAGPDLDVASVPGDPVVLPSLPAGDSLSRDHGPIVDLRPPSRPMLQVWLN